MRSPTTPRACAPRRLDAVAALVAATVALSTLSLGPLASSVAHAQGARALGAPARSSEVVVGASSGAATGPAVVPVPEAYEAVPVPPPPPGASVSPDAGATATGGPTPSGPTIPSGMATRLRALESDFQVLAARGGGGIVDGVLGILTGGLSVTVGVLLDNRLSPYLYTYGGVGVARGALSLALMTNPSAAAVAFTHMPMTSPEELRARLDFGERELASLADQSRLSRILDGSLNVGAGLAIVPIYLGPNNFEIRDTFDWFVLIGAAISSVSGVITLVTESEAERRWAAYEELRDQLAAREEALRRGARPSRVRAPDDDGLDGAALEDEAAHAPALTPSLSGDAGGGGLRLSGRF